MLGAHSVRTRFMVTVAANGTRSLFGFAAGLLIARALSPAGYGDVMFLIGSFAAIRGLLDMGTSSAFFTFISRQPQGPKFYLVYLLWTIAQVVLTLLLIGLLIPQSQFERIWLGHDRHIVALSFFAAFMQQQVLQTITQIGESMRQTFVTQMVMVLAAAIYLVLLCLLYSSDLMTPENILLAMIVQGAISVPSLYWLLKKNRQDSDGGSATVAEITSRYWAYCKPLLLLSVITFLYDFSDKWMLQRFGGASEQGYFQIANQFSNAILLATLSIVNIFWKEIAQAWENKDRVRIAELYLKVTRGLVMFSAIVVGLIVPWSEQIVRVLLGTSYEQAWPVLSLMLLYPIHLPLGIIGGSTLLASGQTRIHMLICAAGMLVSIPVSYLLLAPGWGAWGGFRLGAAGLAMKLVVLSILTVNLQSWLIARHNGWKYEWKFQVIGIPVVLLFGYVSKMLMTTAWDLSSPRALDLLAPVILSSALYATLVIVFIRLFPWLTGYQQKMR
jgi:O-antigen/teichoic acid export membrane protein